MSTSTDRWQLTDVTDGLERRGYQRIAAAGPDARLWYMSPKSSITAEQYVILEHKKTLGIYSVVIGFLNSEVRHVRNRLAAAVVAELGKSVKMAARCWTTFDVGYALKWPLVGIPYPRERSIATHQFTQMREYLTAVLEPIDGPAAMLDRLLSFEAPFDWDALHHPVRRAVEAVATAKVGGHDLVEVENKLATAQSYMLKDSRTGPNWRQLISRICRL